MQSSIYRNPICNQPATRTFNKWAPGELMTDLLLNLTINIHQSFVSLRRIERYLGCAEVAFSTNPPSDVIALRSAFITWPQEQRHMSDSPPRFILQDITLEFPPGQLSLICGRLGSGKSLLLLGGATPIFVSPRKKTDEVKYSTPS